jgi:uncharacterized protein YdeI (YjbR/CyaY-like superfamily)
VLKRVIVINKIVKLEIMEIGKTLYVKNRRQWRRWLEKNYANEPEIWLIYYKKHSGKPRIPYNDAVEEALCFGWIDSNLKPVDGESYAQRFTPRRKNSKLSEMNKERVRRLIKAKLMNAAGLEKIKHELHPHSLKLNKVPKVKKYVPAKDILNELKKDPIVWKNFRKFPQSYKRIRVAWIDGSRRRHDVFKTRLNYFIRMTAKNKKFGMVK